MRPDSPARLTLVVERPEESCDGCGPGRTSQATKTGADRRQASGARRASRLLPRGNLGSAACRRCGVFYACGVPSVDLPLEESAIWRPMGANDGRNRRDPCRACIVEAQTAPRFIDASAYVSAAFRTRRTTAFRLSRIGDGMSNENQRSDPNQTDDPWHSAPETAGTPQ